MSLTFAVHSGAILTTDLAGATTSASSCYTGCGHAGYDASNILDHDLGGTGNTDLNAWNSGKHWLLGFGLLVIAYKARSRFA